MSKKLILGIVVLIALAIAVYFVFFTANEAAAPAETVQVQPTPTQQVATEAQSTVDQPGEYKDYSERDANATQGTKLLFFHAPWCPQCRSLDSSIKSGTVPRGTTIYKVDYDSNQALRQKYGVTIQTTVVKIDDNGNLVKKYVAYDEPTLAAVIKNLP